MQATIYDGHTWRPCSLDDARAACQDTTLSWIDLRLAGADDPAAPEMLTALGIDPASTLDALRAGQGTDFQLTRDAIQGAAWMAGASDSAPVAGRFSFDTRRLVTIRLDGDAAFAEVQGMLASRADLAIKQPSRLLGFVLQAMLATIQESLTSMTINVGLLDLQVISTQVPTPHQGQQLVTLRTTLVPFAVRFPAYVVKLNTALVDPDSITVIDQAGVTELQSVATVAASTGTTLNALVSAVRTTVTDIQGQVANWQGERINQLTVVTFIFLPITFLTGYFGMNFQWLDDGLVSAGAYITFGVVVPLVMVAFCIWFLTRRGFRISLKSRDKGQKPS